MKKFFVPILVAVLFLITPFSHSACAITNVSGPTIDHIGNYSDTLSTAVSDIGATKQLLQIQKPITLTANLTVPANLSLWIPKGGIIATGPYTLTISGSIEAGNYQIFDTSGGGTVKMAAGIVRNPYWWGKSATALQAALTSMVANSKMVIPPGIYGPIEGSISVDIPDHCVIEAYGAQLNFTNDAAGINFNVSNRTQVSDVRWLGGYMYNSAPKKNASTALEFRDFRSIEIAHVYFQGFFKPLLIVDRDSYHVHDCHFFNNKYGIYMDQTASHAKVSSLISRIEVCHFSISGQMSGIYATGNVGSLSIDKCSFNGAVKTSIHIDNTNAPSAMRTFQITNNHFEQGKAFTKYIHMNDISEKAFLGVTIAGNAFNDAAPSAIVLERCKGVDIGGGNTFAQTSFSGGCPINLNANCSNVDIRKSNFFSTASMIYACPRTAFTFGDPYVSTAYTVVIGYNGNSFSTTSATIDMSSAASAIFPTIAGVPPKAWVLSVQARDSASATSTTARVDVATSAGVAAANRGMIRIAGVPDDVPAGGMLTVPSGAKGDIWISIIASGASTMDVWLAIVGYFM